MDMKQLSNPNFLILVWLCFAVLQACVVINEDEYFEFPAERRFVNEMPEIVELKFVVGEDSARVMIPPGDSAVFEGKGWLEGDGFESDTGWKSYNVGRNVEDYLELIFSDGRKTIFRMDPFCSDSTDNPIFGFVNEGDLDCGYVTIVFKNPDLWVERYRIDSTDYALAEQVEFNFAIAR